MSPWCYLIVEGDSQVTRRCRQDVVLAGSADGNRCNTSLCLTTAWSGLASCPGPKRPWDFTHRHLVHGVDTCARQRGYLPSCLCSMLEPVPWIQHLRGFHVHDVVLGSSSSDSGKRAPLHILLYNHTVLGLQGDFYVACLVLREPCMRCRMLQKSTGAVYAMLLHSPSQCSCWACFPS